MATHVDLCSQRAFSLAHDDDWHIGETSGAPIALFLTYFHGKVEYRQFEPDELRFWIRRLFFGRDLIGSN